MRLGWTILYVRDVARAVEFYERAFGLTRRFLHPGGGYAELETGATALAFVSHAQARESLGGEFVPSDPGRPPLGFEVAFVTADVQAAYELAVAAGAAPALAPTAKPWGQVVSYVRDPDGVLVELASPVQGA
ncbi:MAG: VOC family protein [Planctomycetes bacterium]|nr:VOC family protein [Planctomycetota bacterium]